MWVAKIAPENVESLQYGAGASLFNEESVPCNLICEASPLGLRLKKTPSLMDLIQMRLSQVHPAAACAIKSGTFDDGKKDLKSVAGSAIDKMKASNFPASLLTIGNWEYVSRYEGDLVAKCYYAKHKIFWEVLDGGLKNKIEIQWSDIAAIKAAVPGNGPNTLDIVPLFFRETNPQPRKHTLWQATSDFTGGQASIHSSGNPADGFSKELLEEISQHLLSDNPILSASDELLIMSKVNSFCSLLQKDDNGTVNNDDNEPRLMMIPGQASETNGLFDFPTMDTNRTETSPCKQPSLSRKESVGDLLVHLPRIASLPKFLFNISEKI
ncbi:hypothetical protein DsansV1_C21g0167921 [Dioscorea sansibarensis]